LLPKYRGGSPIQTAIIKGEKETGITIMYMASKMDSGDIIAQRKLEIAILGRHVLPSRVS
jgi:methionyl-tRNA formyltransferase